MPKAEPVAANPVKCLQHVALEVADLERSIAFYRDFLGMRVTERHKAGEVEAIPVELVFLRLAANHHDLVLTHNPAKTYPPAPADGVHEAPVFPHHFAYECESREAWLEMLERARGLGLEIVRGPVVHSPWDPRGDGSWGELESFYVFDPDGYKVELFCEMATISEDGVFVTARGERIEQARVDEP